VEVHARRVIEDYTDGCPETDILHRYPQLVPPPSTNELSRRYMLDARTSEVLGELFGEEPLAAQSMMYYKPPGARGQGLHQDQMPLRVSPGLCIAAWIALDRADGENGGMLVVPGSHRLGVVCSRREANEQQFYAGGGLRVPAEPASSPNRTDEARSEPKRTRKRERAKTRKGKASNQEAKQPREGVLSALPGFLGSS